MKRIFIVVAGLLFLMLLDCSKNEQEVEIKQPINIEDLSGVWVHEMEWYGGGPEQALVWIFKECFADSGYFEWHWEAMHPNPFIYTTIAAARGNFLLVKNEIQLIITHFGSQQKEPMSAVFYDSVVWYSPDHQMYELYEFNLMVKCEISGDTLWVSTDENYDGDYLDADEKLKYIKDNNWLVD
jgi:hypothetical protein